MENQGLHNPSPPNILFLQWVNEALASGRSLDWNLELYPGIDGRQTNIAEHDLKFYTANKKSRRLIERPGTLGCFLSQYSLWRKSLDEHKTICIFEHDVLFKKRFSIEKNFEDVIKSHDSVPNPMNVGQWWKVQESIVLNPGAKNC